MRPIGSTGALLFCRFKRNSKPRNLRATFVEARNTSTRKAAREARSANGASQAVNAVALVRSGAGQSLLDLDGVLRVMKDLNKGGVTLFADFLRFWGFCVFLVVVCFQFCFFVFKHILGKGSWVPCFWLHGGKRETSSFGGFTILRDPRKDRRLQLFGRVRGVLLRCNVWAGHQT